jgi:hypothetical protein
VLADSIRATNAPKSAGWVDERALWVTVGYKWGTVSPGGDLYLVNPETGFGAPVWTSEPDTTGRVQAVGVTTAPASLAGGVGGWVVALKVFDENMDNPRDSTAVVPPGAIPWERIGLKPPRAPAPSL